MRVVNVMFDTLCRDFLSNYGNTWTHTPNFKRLQETCIQFDNCYGGSMPCMPARRELQTGMYNFPFRSWGPLEPFDRSIFEAMKEKGIYSHLVTDHSHYTEDGGATYHNRYSTWELFRGQEGDRWQPQACGKVPSPRDAINKSKAESVLQHYANMTMMPQEQDYSCAKTFASGLKFLEEYKDKDQWVLQIESFDPHEPFTVPDYYRKLFSLPEEVRFDWPAYGPIDMVENKEKVAEMRKEYAALLAMCDTYLGKVLDFFDTNDMWKDTILIVNTDHGFLLGEHDMLGKNFPPMYQELIHLPLFIHIPGIKPFVSKQLVQTVDIPMTILDYMGVAFEKTDGHSLRMVIEEDKAIRDYAIFGVHGSSVGITDGKYVYFQSSVKKDMVECTLMPTQMRGFFKEEQLKKATLAPGNRFTHGVPYLKIPSSSTAIDQKFGDLLFNIEEDPKQTTNLLPHPIQEEFRHTLSSIFDQLEVPQEERDRLGI